MIPSVDNMLVPNRVAKAKNVAKLNKYRFPAVPRSRKNVKRKSKRIATHKTNIIVENADLFPDDVKTTELRSRIEINASAQTQAALIHLVRVRGMGNFQGSLSAPANVNGATIGLSGRP